MDRRTFFRVLPLSLLGLPTALKAEPDKESIWVEVDCPLKNYGRAPDCNTRYKVLRGAVPVCPNCGCQAASYYGTELGKLMCGIEVKK